ncbi:MAG: UDPGP type 1 family protein [Planctomycetaceae bacterium]|nr:UDPGP type 1 family protein [Planctomycetaceae bacterium]
MDPYRDMAVRLAPYGQEHLLDWWSELDPAQKHALLKELQALDWDRIAPLLGGDAAGSEEARERAARAQPPLDLVRLPEHGGDAEEWARAREYGETLLKDGKVGAILVAGGQGTRLGFDHPKGMFKIGPVSGKPLFQLFCEQLAGRERRAGQRLPYYIMTSSATHEETRRYFQEQHYFGLDVDDVSFFQQGALPAVDRAGRILLDEKTKLTASPDGHGGLLHALRRSGLLTVMADRGIEYLYYHQVDNPAAIVCDPAFIGLHALHGSEMSTKVVAKSSAAERMGAVVSVDGRTEIIEYSDLPAERAAAKGPNGELLLWAGNTAMHVFNHAFLERLVVEGCRLPLHRAFKSVPHIDETGERVTPAEPNAYKFEQFIFDALPLALGALVVEADRQREFLPVKNRDGADSPDTVRAGLLKLYREWLTHAGAEVSPQARVEISPRFALDAAELAEKVPSGTRFNRDRVLE